MRALSASPYATARASGALRLDLAGAIVEQPAERDPLGRARRRLGDPRISARAS